MSRFGCTLLLALCPIIATADEVIVMQGFGNKELFMTSDKGKVSEDGKTFTLDTLDRTNPHPWSIHGRTTQDVIQPATAYLATFKLTIEQGPDKEGFVHILCRPISDGTGNSDTLRYNVKENQPDRTYSIPFNSGADFNDYAFQIHAYKNVKATFTDFKITRRPDPVFFPFSEKQDEFKGDLNLPAGAKDFEVILPQKQTPVVKATDFGFSTDAEDNVEALNKAIQHCKDTNAAKLELAPGTYRCTAEKPINIHDMVDFTFDGKAAKLVFYRKRHHSIDIRNCQRTLVTNLVIDWDWEIDPLASLVKVVKTDEKSFDFEFVHYKRFPKRDVRCAIISAYDPETKSVGIEGGVTRGFEFMAGRNPKTDYTWISDNVMRINEKPGRLKVGDLYRLQHYYYDRNCFNMSNNVHLTLKDIDILSTSGHALLITGTQHHWQFDNVNIVAPKDDPKRVITCTADHCHVAQSRGFFKMANCEFSLGADDILNVHDNAGFARKSGEYSITTQNARIAGSFKPGTMLELRQGDYSPSGFSGKVKELKTIDAKGGIYEIIFETPVPEQKFDGFVIFNWTFDSRNIIVKDCFFHDNRARGLLILARDVTIENTRFRHHEMGAIKIETGYTFNVWSEGYGADNIVVRNCTFESVNPTNSSNDGKARDIFMGVYMKSDPSAERTEYPILANILFENNTFKETYGLVAFISSAGNVTFRNNTFINNKPRNKNLPYRGSFYVTHASNVNVVNNTYVKSPYINNPGVQIQPDTVKNVIVQGNKTVDEK